MTARQHLANLQRYARARELLDGMTPELLKKLRAAINGKLGKRRLTTAQALAMIDARNKAAAERKAAE